VIDDVVPEGAWHQLSSTGERFLPWADGWFQKSGLLLGVNFHMFQHGMQVAEVYRDNLYAESVGFDVIGTGSYPMPPFLWNNPEMMQSVNTWRRLVTPRMSHDT